MRKFSALYGAAHFGKSLIWHTSGMLFAFFLTEICAIPPTSMGWILACDMLFSAAADAGFGRLLRGHVGSLAKAGRLQLPGVVVSGVLLLAFTATPLLPESVRIAYALVLCVSFRLAYSFQDIPENSMLYLVEGDTRRRLELSSLRFVASGLAAVAVGAAASLLIGGGPDQRASRFLAFAGTIVPLWILVSYGLYLGSRSGNSARRSDQTGSDPRRGRDFSMRPTTLIGLVMLVAGSGTVFGNLLPYFAAQALNGGFSRLASLALIGLGNVACQPLWGWIGRRSGTVGVCRAAAAVTASGAALFFLGASRHAAIAAASGLLIEAGLNGLSMLIWASFADHVARSPLGFSIRSATLAMGVFTASIKIAGAVSILMVGQLLSRIDYHDIVVATSWHLLGPMTIVPFLAGGLCFLVTWREGSAAS